MGTSTASNTNDPIDTIGGLTYYGQNNGAANALTTLANGTVRFSVDGNSHWGSDRSSVNRSELANMQQIANGTAVEASYTLAVQQGGIYTDPDAWVVVGQFHQDNGAHAGPPPFAMALVQGKMVVQISYTDVNGQDVTKWIWTDSANIVQGKSYNIDVKATFDPNGNGKLVVTRDGTTLVNYSGRLGYASQSSVYWKEGIYRSATDATMVADYSNTKIAIGAAAIAASNTSASASPPVATNGASQGAASQPAASTGGATVSYSNDGGQTKKTTLAANGTKTVDYLLNGQVTQHQEYAAGGAMTVQQIYTGGVLTYQSKLNPDGSTLYSQYDGHGTLTRKTLQYASGARDVTNVGITGQAYTSQTASYDAGNHLTSLTTKRSDGSIVSATTYNSDGSRDIAQYGITTGQYVSSLTHITAGNVMTHLEQVAANGSKVVSDYAIQGQPYTTQVVQYDASKTATSTARYHADGTLAFYQSLAGNGTRTTNLYDGAGHTTQTAAVTATGAITAKSYATGVTLTSGSANDTFTSFHNDIFAFHSRFGHDTLNNFNAGSGSSHDVIQLSKSLAADFSHLTMTQTGADTLLSFSDGSALTLTHTKTNSLVAADFKFV